MKFLITVLLVTFLNATLSTNGHPEDNVINEIMHEKSYHSHEAVVPLVRKKRASRRKVIRISPRNSGGSGGLCPMTPSPCQQYQTPPPCPLAFPCSSAPAAAPAPAPVSPLAAEPPVPNVIVLPAPEPVYPPSQFIPASPADLSPPSFLGGDPSSFGDGLPPLENDFGSLFGTRSLGQNYKQANVILPKSIYMLPPPPHPIRRSFSQPNVIYLQPSYVARRSR